MKNLIFINGTMGIGKTTTSKELQKRFPACVFLDGDWCWDSGSFIVTDETKAMVLDNIIYLLNNFLGCTAYQNIVFCWVMHEEWMMQQILERLQNNNCRVFLYSLICSEETLKEHLEKDIFEGTRTEEALEESILRLCNYESMCTTKVDVTDQTAKEAAEWIFQDIERKSVNYTIRKIRKLEYPLLDVFIYEAIFVPEGVAAPSKAIINNPDIQVYVSGFGTREDDCCVVAEADNKVIGAAWVRIMNDYGHIDDETPSLAISVYKKYRGLGIGTSLLKNLLSILKARGYRKTSLAVQKANYALKMYQSAGYGIVDENEQEYIMINYLE